MNVMTQKTQQTEVHLKENVELFIHVPIADLIKVIAIVNVNIVSGRLKHGS